MNRLPVAIVVALMFGPALAQERDATTPFFVPENSVSVGVGVSSGDEKDRARFGLFNGLRKNDANGLLDFNYTNRDSAAGRLMILEGRNLGLDNREFGYSYRNLGDFKLKVDYSELVRHDPRTINTSLTGAGTATPTVSLLATPGTGSDLNLELKRKGLGLDLSKRYGNFEIEVNFKNEDKSGARFFGRGFACSTTYDRGAGTCSSSTTPTTLLMLPEPIDSTIRQLDAKLNYSDGKLNLSGGYYGSFYTNNFGSLNPTITGATFGNLNGGTVAMDANQRLFLQGPMALWPDSQAHQVFLGGNYKLTDHTKLNFKYSYTHATQNESFGGMGLSGAPAGRDNLGGVLNTTKAQLGFSSHPWAAVHVHGDISYESKDNKTPIALYNQQVATNNANPALVTFSSWTNSAMSPRKFDAKLEGSYKLPQSMLLVGGLKYEREDVGAWTPTDIAGGISALRQKTDSWSGRVELRKTMSDTFTGSVALYDERRSGASSWLRPLSFPLTGVINASQDCAAGSSVTALTVANAGCVFNRTGEIAFTQKDMQRQKIRLNGNWEPSERWSVQGFLDVGNDDYRGPTTSGLSNSKMYTLSLDASYRISDDWRVNGYLTTGERSMVTGHSTDYNLTLKDISTTAGIGFSGTPFARFKIGGDLIAMIDTLKYNMTPDEFASSATITLLNQSGGLPDVTYKLLRIKLYGEYTVNKSSMVRFDYVYNRTFFNEWTYGNNGVPFLYSDNTTLTAKQTQSVNYLGASYVYRFQ